MLPCPIIRNSLGKSELRVLKKCYATKMIDTFHVALNHMTVAPNIDAIFRKEKKTFSTFLFHKSTFARVLVFCSVLLQDRVVYLFCPKNVILQYFSGQETWQNILRVLYFSRKFFRGFWAFEYLISKKHIKENGIFGRFSHVSSFFTSLSLPFYNFRCSKKWWPILDPTYVFSKKKAGYYTIFPVAIITFRTFFQFFQVSFQLKNNHKAWQAKLKPLRFDLPARNLCNNNRIVRIFFREKSAHPLYLFNQTWDYLI